jgi:hypothetical protein
MKKLIVEEVNLFRSEVRAAARTSQNRQCVSQFPVLLPLSATAPSIFFSLFFAHGSGFGYLHTQVDDPITRRHRCLPDS